MKLCARCGNPIPDGVEIRDGRLHYCSQDCIKVAHMHLLNKCHPWLTKQQYKTLKGQILSGDSQGAMKGLVKLMTRRRRQQCATTTL